MSTHCTTTAHRLWLPLLVAVVLYVVNDISSAGEDSPLFGCEPDVKPVFMEPGDDDSQDKGTQSHGNRPTLQDDQRMAGVDAASPRKEAETLTLNRGPPAGNQAPA